MKLTKQDIVGKKFGRLTVISYSGIEKNKSSFNCSCDCGNDKVISRASLVSNKTQSCGCLRSELCKKRQRKNKGEAGFNNLYKRYKRRADRDGFSFSLTQEQFQILISHNCDYCGVNPLQKTNINSYRKKDDDNWSEILYNGIDRVDNNLGYILENCVTCCKHCNMSKNNRTKEEFLEWIERVYNYNV